MEHLLIGLASIVVLGIGAQWLSWRLRMPAILLLLVVGFVAGPVTGFLHPDELLGDLVFPIVSLSVAVILFEGGLSLNVAELRDLGRVVGRLLTLGALITWVLSTAFAMLLLDLSGGLALLLGAVLIVTGPTVIVPLLRHIRPTPRVGSAVKWEGIVNDPVGAILGVLVFEAIIAGGIEAGLGVVVPGMMRAVVVGALTGLLAAGFVVLLLHRHWIPDYLESPVALALVVMAYAVSNRLQMESGLLAVTVMGSALASQKRVSVRQIVEFKENLRVLLIAALFIILAARLPLTDPDYFGAGSLLFLAALVLVVRPLAVLAATWRSRFNWRERVFIAAMAPRGIVAAAIVSVFALGLVDAGREEAARLVPLIFVVIVGTVGVYGIVTPILARLLRVASPNAKGMLFIGGGPWVIEAATLLKDLGVDLVVADSNWQNVSAARSAGLRTYHGNVLTEGALEEIELQLDGIGRFLALTPNDEVNTLATVHFRELFDSSRMYQLPPEETERERRQRGIPQHLRGRLLFNTDATHAYISERFRGGAIIKRTRLTDEFDYDAFREYYGERAVPLFSVKESGDIVIHTTTAPPSPKSGQTLISLVDPAD
jgi:NhaP-type Na+/H+ or K+/H+ antiporter